MDFLGYVIFHDGVYPRGDRVVTLAGMAMPADTKQLHSLLGGHGYHRKFLSSIARRMRPITALQENGAMFDSDSAMQDVIRSLITELIASPVLVVPDWDVVLEMSHPFHLYCDASSYGVGTMFKQERPDSSVRPIVYISRAALDKEQG